MNNWEIEQRYVEVNYIGNFKRGEDFDYVNFRIDTSTNICTCSIFDSEKKEL